MSKAAEEEGANSREEQAADWCVRLAEGTLSAAEQCAFDVWIADSDNQVAMEEASTVWRSIDAAADKAEFIRFRSEALEMFRRANSQRWARRMPARWRWPAGLAASLLLAVTAVAWFLHHPTKSFATGIGERRVVMLDDGTRLSLDAATRIEARIAKDRRELRLLHGRARFDVAQDPLRPFTVSAASKVVVALGTSFSVELLQRQMHVILYEGQVQVLERENASMPSMQPLQNKRGSGRSQSLLPGRQLVASLDTAKAEVLPADLQRSSSWEAGQLNLANEPLESAVERMNRYSKVKLLLKDASVAGFKVNGVFTAGDVEAFIEGVTTFSPVRVVREGDVIVLESAKPGTNSSGDAVPEES
jgi:transmembrane sensor